ncbi:FadR/GntR family transcriptional regulator [Propionibacteriaceae bacterium G1746]
MVTVDGPSVPAVVRLDDEPIHDLAHPSLRRYFPSPEPGSQRRSEVYEVIGQRICAGLLLPGTVLNMDELATRFGVSRPVVREACGALNSLGLVVSRRRVGTVVQPPENWELFSVDIIRWRLNSPGRAAQVLELAELRSSIEPAAAELAALRATEPERAAIGVCLEVLLTAGRSGDIPGFHEADKQFHTLVMTSGHNRMFGQMHRVVEGLLESRYRQGLMPSEVAQWALRWHEQLGLAVVAGDTVAAIASARSIVAASAQEMLELAKLPAPDLLG